MDFVKSPTGTYVHDDEHFFPLDGQGWNDTRIGLLAIEIRKTIRDDTKEAGDGCYESYKVLRF